MLCPSSLCYKRGTDVDCEPRQKRNPSIAHGHARKLPDEEHNPVTDPRRPFVTKNNSTHSLQLRIFQALSKLLSVRDIVEDGLGLNRRYNSPDGTDERAEPESVAHPDGVFDLSPGNGSEGSTGTE